jgi:hypothetical protein
MEMHLMSVIHYNAMQVELIHHHLHNGCVIELDVLSNWN